MLRLKLCCDWVQLRRDWSIPGDDGHGRGCLARRGGRCDRSAAYAVAVACVSDAFASSLCHVLHILQAAEGNDRPPHLSLVAKQVQRLLDLAGRKAAQVLHRLSSISLQISIGGGRQAWGEKCKAATSTPGPAAPALPPPASARAPTSRQHLSLLGTACAIYITFLLTTIMLTEPKAARRRAGARDRHTVRHTRAIAACPRSQECAYIMRNQRQSCENAACTLEGVQALQGEV